MSLKINRIHCFNIIFLISALIYVFALFRDMELLLRVASTFISGLLLLLYVLRVQKKIDVFVCSLFFFFISESFYFVGLSHKMVAYYIGNTFSILAYVSFFAYLISGMSFKRLFKELLFYVIILLALGVYLFYQMDVMVRLGTGVYSFNYLLESVYSLFVVLVLVFSVIHYLYYIHEKRLLLFLSGLFLSFSELGLLFFIFIKSERVVGVVYSSLLLIGFYFLYCYILFREKQRK